MAHAPDLPPLGHSFTVLPVVDSTNKYAMGVLQQPGLTDRQGQNLHGQAFFAAEQTAGRGQRGKSWNTEPGANIILSLIIRPENLGLHEQFFLSAAIALGVSDFFSRYAGEEDTRIKWPNDLYWRDRKAGGILIESIIGDTAVSGGWKWAVAGMGININQVHFPDTIPNPVSLRQITGKTYDARLLAAELCTCLESRYRQLCRGEQGEILSAYNQRLYKLHQTARLKKENRVFEAMILGVTAQGRLRVQHSTEEEFGFGETEWIIPA